MTDVVVAPGDAASSQPLLRRPATLPAAADAA